MYNVHLTHSLLCFEFVEFTLLYYNSQDIGHIRHAAGKIPLAFPQPSERSCHCGTNRKRYGREARQDGRQLAERGKGDVGRYFRTGATHRGRVCPYAASPAAEPERDAGGGIRRAAIRGILTDPIPSRKNGQSIESKQKATPKGGWLDVRVLVTTEKRRKSQDTEYYINVMIVGCRSCG